MGNRLPRRSLLYSASATALAGLAGCLATTGDDAGNGGDSGSSDGGGASESGDGGAGGAGDGATDEPADASEASADEAASDDADETPDDEPLPGADDEVIVVLGPDERPTYDPRHLHVRTGATVRFEWDTGGHDLVVDSQPPCTNWEGVTEPADAGHVHERTFETPGFYRVETTTHDVPTTFRLRVSEHGRPYHGVHPSEEGPDPVDWTDVDEGTIAVGPGGHLEFDPDEVEITPGTTLTFEWQSEHHNVRVHERPPDASWNGVTEVRDGGTTHEHTFTEPGIYRYVCEPHQAAGMSGAVVVSEE